MDDLLICSCNMKVINTVNNVRYENFEMQDLGELEQVLCIEVQYDRENKKMKINQAAAVCRLLHCFGMEDSKAVRTPMELKMGSDDKSSAVSETMYRSAIGSIMYIMMGTRPDLAHRIGFWSRFSQNPTEKHWKGVKRFMWYLKGTKEIGLLYYATEGTKIIEYSDADWANGKDRNSISGSVFFLSGNLVSWLSKNKTNFTLSTAEYETVALCESVKEGLWLKKLAMDMMEEVNIFTVMVDKQAAISLTKQEGCHGRTKHIDINYLFVQ